MLTRFGLASNTLYALYLAIKNTGFKESCYQWLLETIAMASRNHCNGFPKPLQWLCETIAMEVKETTFSESIAMAS